MASEGRKRKIVNSGDNDEGDDGSAGGRRSRYTEPVASRLRRGIISIGEGGSGIEEIKRIGSLLGESMDDDLTVKTFFEWAISLLMEQSMKIPFVSAVCMWANALDRRVGERIIHRVKQEVEWCIREGEWRRVKCLLRFIACSQWMIENGAESMGNILEELFARAADLQASWAKDTLGIELVKIILLTIPYLIVVGGAEDWTEQANELLDRTEVIAGVSSSFDDLVGAIPSSTTGKGGSWIVLIQRQLRSVAKQGWKIPCLPSVCRDIVHALRQQGKECGTVKFDGINVRERVNVGDRVVYAEEYISLFDQGEHESVPRSDDIAGTLIRDALVDTINVLDFNRCEAARFLMEMGWFWGDNTFAERGIAYDKLSGIPEGQSRWKREDLAIDALFSQIMMLPTPEHKLVYYHSVVTECCKLAPAGVAPSLGRAIRFLYARLGGWDLEVEYRFMDWFAHHLSNFEFRWKWDEWKSEVSLSRCHVKRAFLTGVLDKEVRLSFTRRIRESLPEEFHLLVPVEKGMDTPDFKFNETSKSEWTEEAQNVVNLIKRRGVTATEEEIEAIHDQVAAKLRKQNKSDEEISEVWTDIYMTSVVYVGSKSLSHFLSAIDRAKDYILRMILEGGMSREVIIRSVVEYWKYRPGTAVGIVDKLLNYTIILPESVIRWALGPKHLGNGEVLADAWLYDMVSGTLMKVGNRLGQIREAVIRGKVRGDVDDGQMEKVWELFTRERTSLSEMFNMIEQALHGVRNSCKVESSSPLTVASHEMVMEWANRWLRVFERWKSVGEIRMMDHGMEIGVEALRMQQEVQAERQVASE